MLVAQPKKKLFKSPALGPPPRTPVEPVAERLHGVDVVDPYRWLEDRDSASTRRWLEEQTRYTRAYLENIPGRHCVRKRIEELLQVETFDSLQKVGSRYFFRKRLACQEQPCIYMRESLDGEDQLLINPAARGTGNYTAVKILQISMDGKLLAYEVKHGGERSGLFEILDIERRSKLPDHLPRGFLRGFAFAPDSKSFYYVHRPLHGDRPYLCVAYCHLLGSDPRADQEVFFAGEEPGIRLGICSDYSRVGFLTIRLDDRKTTSLYLQEFGSSHAPRLLFQATGATFVPILLDGRILALTDQNAPNLRIVELLPSDPKNPVWSELVPEIEARIRGFAIAAGRLFVSYVHNSQPRLDVYDLSGTRIGELHFPPDETVRILPNRPGCDEILYESESFTRPPAIYRYRPEESRHALWAKQEVPFQPADFISDQVWFASKDGTKVPMFLVGRRDILGSGVRPTILTGYGGFGASMTPQFSVFVNFLMEQGCVFAMANLRGGAEFGEKWHQAGQRHNRQRAFDDFISAAEWLVRNGHTTPENLAIFGGSNSGLLVAVALTQRPDLFSAVVCIAPLTDMLRYHLFDSANSWKDEFGAAGQEADFAVLYAYSPYHRVRKGAKYPATLVISGDADSNCNPLHARKLVARLQVSNASPTPVLLDYKEYRGHSPVLPLTERIEGLTDRLAFVCEQLRIPIR